jgi:antitoxin (DNA-binding transcriptional repressor) of toxin-antitoxin stability system
MHQVNLKEAETQLEKLIEEAASGEEVIITRSDGSSFKIMPVSAVRAIPKFTRCATFPNPLTLNPSPRAGEGLRATLAPLLPTWEKGLGDEGELKSHIALNLVVLEDW